MDSQFQRGIWDVTEGPDLAMAGRLVEEVLAAGAIPSYGTYKDVLDARIIIPMTKTRIEDELPVDERGKTLEEIRAARWDLARQKAAAFRDLAKPEQARLRAALEGLKVTLHAHSQGAIISAVAQNRVGVIPRTRSFQPEEYVTSGTTLIPSSRVSVTDKIAFVSYGGGANMHDYGPKKYFKSYAHHVNNLDIIANAVGMIDAFEFNPLVQGASAALVVAQAGSQLESDLTFGLSKKLIRSATKGSAITSALIGEDSNPHTWKVLLGPSDTLLEAWKAHHQVVWHIDLTGWMPDIQHHNFTNAYICNVGTETTDPGEPVWTTQNLRRVTVRTTNPRETQGRNTCPTD